MRWIALGVFVVAGITDYFDGYLARAWSQQSALGRMLDPIADKLLVAACLLMLVADRTISSWSIWAANRHPVARVLVSGLREYLAELRVSVPVSAIAKWKTTLQLVAVGFLIAGPPASRCCRHGGDGPRAAVDRRVADALHRLGLFPRGHPPRHRPRG